MSTSSAPSSGFLTVGGARLYYDDQGAGSPIVLIHAGIADSRMWDAQMARLSAHYRVIRFDLRGFGKSETEPEPFSDVADLAELFRALDIEPAVVVGASMGARVAVELALERPNLVRALLLVAPGLFRGLPPSEPLAAGWRAMEQAYEAGDTDRMLELELGLWVDGPRRSPHQVEPSLRERVRDMNAVAYRLEALASGRQSLSPPAVERLNELKVPTLVVVGDEDQRDILDIADYLVDQISDAREVVVRDAAHMLTMERPEEFNALVVEFVKSLNG